jgi:hypothetical protein
MSPFDHSQLHDEIRKEIERAGPFASINEINRRLAALNESYNNRPQADLGGLSPQQMAELLYGDWEGNGALRLNSSLTLADLDAAPMLVDARTVLAYVMEHGPIKMTPAGNLPRRAVEALLPQLKTDAMVDYQRPRTINEGDVLWLFVLRHTLQIAKLLVRRGGVVVSKTGRHLAGEDHAGELFALLFRTFFRTFNLTFMDNSDRHPGLQSTIAFSFYRLQTEAREWSVAETLAESSWHPDMKDPATSADLQYGDGRHWAFTHRVLKPLVQFGLMERRAVDPAAKWKEKEYRVTSLYDRFMSFSG